MSNLFEQIKEQLANADKKIVFPEGRDERILTAASQLGAAGIVTPILLGDKQEIMQKAESAGVDVSACRLIDPHDFPEFDEMIDVFVKRRKGKVTAGEARQILLDENYFGTMLVYMDKADGLVSGAAHSTSDTVRQIGRAHV